VWLRQHDEKAIRKTIGPQKNHRRRVADEPSGSSLKSCSLCERRLNGRQVFHCDLKCKQGFEALDAIKKWRMGLYAECNRGALQKHKH
jgi:hypothetical protein